ncbi:MAG: hypothetical protein IPJ93_01180 [Bacteroidota bacterium]|nr:MAG: hypothetical protein IPJ93_01180 [Bacteroidota bacterium]
MKKLFCFLLLYQIGYGQVWKPFILPFLYPGVFDFRNFNNQLLVAGDYTADSSTLNNIARWDGSDWQPLDSGMLGGVYAMEEFNGELHIGGYFYNINNILNTRKIARWDGVTFHPLAKGITSGVR